MKPLKQKLGKLSAPPVAGLNATAPADWISVVSEQVKTTRFGVVQIVIHDSKVVQIDHTERTRFPAAGVGKV